ncbi:DUF3099 domain-containing protein [Microbacterium mangrovi]|uniref:DUF3099 domain-containing protein n=1 Tax=Microbacterium mangrovi TaxID=1348253 RepID=UPI0009DE0599|nr:DUF3099 domain-containing protein [Microbacterium mangrovi]
MKHEIPQSATSLPAAPEREVDRRSTRYLIMMGIRVVCFALMVLVHPYGWYTWVFCIAAVFLPYIAVVLANVGQESKTPAAVDPEMALPAPPAAPPEHGPTVIRINEAKHLGGGADADRHEPGSAG